MRAVRHHTDCAWVLLYIERWLRASVRMTDGTLENRKKGSAQGSVVSPILANLFQHYTFDMWMQRQFPGCPFERYADDAITHCGSENQARQLLDKLQQRFAECNIAARSCSGEPSLQINSRIESSRLANHSQAANLATSASSR